MRLATTLQGAKRCRVYWPNRRRCKQAGSKDGSLGRWCESFDQFSRFDETAPNNRLPDERFSRTAGRSGSCATARATCIRRGALRSQLDRCWGQNVELVAACCSDVLKVEGLTRFQKTLSETGRNQWNHGSLPPPCLEYGGDICA